MRVKICGLTTPAAVEAASGADYAGFIFYPPSPRNLTPAKAAVLTKDIPIPAVAVTVDPTNELLKDILAVFKPAYLQLQGNETPERVQQIKGTFRIHIIKAFRISTGDDISKAHAYESAADMLLFDACVPKGLPGGTGQTFDWKLLAGKQFRKPWFLSGGLTSDNVEEAMKISGAKMVDVSSSLESSPGVKDPAKVRTFIKKVKTG